MLEYQFSMHDKLTRNANVSSSQLQPSFMAIDSLVAGLGSTPYYLDSLGAVISRHTLNGGSYSRIGGTYRKTSNKPPPLK